MSLDASLRPGSCLLHHERRGLERFGALSAQLGSPLSEHLRAELVVAHGFSRVDALFLAEEVESPDALVDVEELVDLDVLVLSLLVREHGPHVKLSVALRAPREHVWSLLDGHLPPQTVQTEHVVARQLNRLSVDRHADAAAHLLLQLRERSP